MPYIIVTADHDDRGQARVLHSERVMPAHLDDDHSSTQLIQRLAWAVADANKPHSDRA